MMPKYTKYLIAGILLIGAGALFYNKVYIPKTTYETVTPTKGDLSVEIFGIGNVGANHIYSIGSQTGGRILSIHTDAGKWVKKGDLLIEIDPVDIPQLLEEAKIAAKKAVSEYNATEKELVSLYAQRQLAEVTYRRYAKLKAQSFASKAEYDKAKADLGVIDAQIAATKAHIQSAKMEITRAQKSVQALEEKASRYTIYAPIDGYVTTRKAEVAQTVLPSQTILQIVDPKSVWVQTYIDEKLAGSVKVGQDATIRLRSQLEKRFVGKVSRIVPESDPVTKEREVDVAFEDLPMPFYMNEQAEVTIASKTYHDVLKVPVRALNYYQGRSGVWVEKEGKAHFVPLKILVRGRTEAAVEGLDGDSRILIEAANKKPLKEGASVHG